MRPTSPRYRVVPVHPAAHLFEVTLTVERPDPVGQVLSLPTWIPGSYMIREFSKHVVRLVARCDGVEVPCHKLDKATWQVAPVTGTLEVRYEVYAWDLSVRTAHLDQSHGFFNGTSLCLMVHGQEHGPHELEVVAPEDPACEGWRVATAMRRVSGAEWGFGRFVADNYDELIDHPFELGTFELVSFEACDVPHHVALTGRLRCDTARLIADLRPICEQHIRFFGEPAPMERYVFLVMAVGDGYGGLEHRASTALICKREDLPQPGVSELTDGYRQFLGLCSHEYFHTWNVKRIKPRAFVPYDLSREAHTALLWAFEGITSYYDDLGLLRSGRIEQASWLELLGRTITQVQRGSGRSKQSVSDSSFDAWTKYYRQDENSPNAIVSYYAKGSLVALALDLELRRRTEERVGLDTVMRALWARYGDGSGVDEAGVEALAAELAGSDLSAFFDQAVRGTEDLPLAELLAWVGLRLQLRASTGDKDQGGTPGAGSGLAEPGDLGVKVATHPLGARLAVVHDGGAAQRAGLSGDDVVIAFDGLRVGVAELTARARALPAGTTVRVHAFRRDELVERTVTLTAPAANTAWVVPDEQATNEAVARRERWLRGATRL
jgi:predicted metalloprotease with PDZ domain